MEMGVPIFQGRIDKTLFLANLSERPWFAPDAAVWTLMDSSGNLIDSFTKVDEALKALAAIRKAGKANAEHVALIAYNHDGDPVEPPGPRRVRVSR